MPGLKSGWKTADGSISAQVQAPAQPGAYLLTLAAEGAAPASTPFLVVEGGEELADARCRTETLQSLSAGSGGRHFERLSDVPDLDELVEPTLERVGAASFAPLSGLWPGLAVIALFCLEWWLRRRWGER